MTETRQTLKMQVSITWTLYFNTSFTVSPQAQVWHIHIHSNRLVAMV